MSQISAKVNEVLSQFIDPELRRPITELGMVGDVQMTDSGISSSTTGGTVVVVVEVLEDEPPAAKENTESANKVSTESAPIRRRS